MTATATRDAAQVPDTGIPGLAGFVEFLETGVAREGVFADDLFADLSFPHWRLQATSAAELVAIRGERHPWPGRVRVERAAPTPSGFVVALEERWHAEGQDWYCREGFWADVQDGMITGLRVMCTGDWDEALQRAHAEAVTLTRP
ncbi:MAG: hypothetical protein LCH96_08275 [Actinobacteria bacterium]|nr:hypothetical protein [Actinomycetota bacterium]